MKKVLYHLSDLSCEMTLYLSIFFYFKIFLSMGYLLCLRSTPLLCSPVVQCDAFSVLWLPSLVKLGIMEAKFTGFVQG